MKSLRAWLFRFRGWFRRRAQEAEMRAEMEAHLEGLTERKIADGMAPAEARRAAVLAFGGVEQVVERARDQRRSVWLEQLGQDVRYGLRQLRKNPGFSLVAIVSLALGIGANTAIFGVTNAYLLKTMPVSHPDGLVQLQWQSRRDNAPKSVDWTLGADVDPDTGSRTNVNFSLETLAALRRESTTLQGVTGVAALLVSNVLIDQQAEAVIYGQLVVGNYHQVLGVRAWRGRTLLPEDDQPGAPSVCVISRQYWESRWAENPAAIGQIILINRVPTTIVGVMPAEFPGSLQLGHQADITLPMEQARRVRRDGASLGTPGHCWLRVIARLAPGVSRAQAQARLEGVFQQSVRDDLNRSRDENLPRLLVVSGAQVRSELVRQQVADLLRPMSWMVGLLLLAGCANVANLLLARGAARRRDIAVRLALGAGRGRLIRQLLVEGLLLASAAAGLGLVVAQWLLQLFASLGPAESSGYMSVFQLEGLIPDWRVLVFTAGVAGLVGILFSLTPALRSTRLNLAAEFQGGGRSLGSGALSRLGQLLVVVQIAVSAALLIGSVLLVRTMREADRIDLGFQPEQRLLFGVDAQSAGYRSQENFALFERLADRLRTDLPGVRAVSYSGWPVLTGEGGPFFAPLNIPAQQLDTRGTSWNPIEPEFFKTYGIPLRQGRSFSVHDRAGTPGVAIVNQAFVREYFGGEAAIGQIINLRGAREIVGVVSDARLLARELKGKIEPLVFIPFAQSDNPIARFVVHTSSDPMPLLPAMQSIVSQVDPNVALVGVSTQTDHVRWKFLNERTMAWLAGLTGIIALVLVSVGLYGLMSYAVLRRTSEIGIRIALGALSQRVVWMIVRESLSIVLVGLVAGVALAAGTTRLLESSLMGLSPTDPLTYGAVSAFLVAVALLACGLPAWRAANVDPMVALRAE